MDESRGISASLRRLATRSLGVLTNRLELFLLELREEQGRILSLLLLAVAIGVLSLLTLILISFALVVLFWNTARMPVLLGMIGFYVLAAGLAAWRMNRLLKSGNPFSATIEELKKDREWLEKES